MKVLMNYQIFSIQMIFFATPSTPFVLNNFSQSLKEMLPHNLLLDTPKRNEVNRGIIVSNRSRFRRNEFGIACEKNNIIIVKRVYEILKTLQVDLIVIKNTVMEQE